MNGNVVAQTVAQMGQMLDEGVPQHKILASLVRAAEAIGGEGAVSSILVLDKEGLLRNGSSPGLPYDYLTAIDGLKPNPNVGTCAAAAATGCMVITPDFRADNKWAELRHLPMALGFVGAWSMPIKSPDGTVLGTFGTYYRESHSPSEEEISALQSLAAAAAKVLGQVDRTSVSPTYH
jgi:GAF domain-containing protein